MATSEAGRKEADKETLRVTFSLCQEGNYCLSGFVGPEWIQFWGCCLRKTGQYYKYQIQHRALVGVLVSMGP